MTVEDIQNKLQETDVNIIVELQSRVYVTHTHTHTHTYTHIHNMHTHTCIHTHIHTHTHTRAYVSSPYLSVCVSLPYTIHTIHSLSLFFSQIH